MSAGSQADINVVRPRNRICHGDIYTAPEFTYTVGPSCAALRLAVSGLSRLDDFHTNRIGSGFFSEVFKVTHKTTGQVMVLKMNMSHSNRPNMLREVQLMNRLSHPNILRFMGVCVHEGQLHALTEYINGGSLEQLLLDKTKELSWQTRVKLALHIACGMRYLHSRGVFHRDLTSKNVLIKQDEKDMTGVVGDFGLAEKIPDPLSKFRLPTVGSPYWMSPECLKGEWYNEKGDVFSYGIILCEIIARIEADPDILPRTENFGLDYIAFSEMCPDCPPEFLKLAFHCCMMDPKQRPSFSDIFDSLEVILPLISEQEGTGEDSDGDCSSPKNEDNVAATNYKMLHRRSKSEDTLLAPNNGFSSPSDKARCHVHTRQKSGGGGESGLDCTRLTPKHIGEVMSLGDPYYRPGGRNQNPFASMTRFRDGKKILASSRELFSSCFELPSPSSANTTDGKLTSGNAAKRRSHLLRSNSLPSSALGNAAAATSTPCVQGMEQQLHCSVSVEVNGVANQGSADESSRLNYPSWGPHQHHRRNRSDDNVMNSAVSEVSSLTLFPTSTVPLITRRGSCESGFFSVGGDTDRISTTDDLSPELTFDDASSSSASSSLSMFSNKCVASPRSSCIEADELVVEEYYSGPRIAYDGSPRVAVQAKETTHTESYVHDVAQMTCVSLRTMISPLHHEERLVQLLEVSSSQSPITTAVQGCKKPSLNRP